MAETGRKERKVVTVVFADLVGFTGRSETLDPEDVEAILGPYHARLRTELERHGGTVEKFIGDAVMAVFGAPVAHEDDPERAVRAALAIRDWAVDDGSLEVRIAVNTGPALVALEARPEAGEAMVAGDVVNTAARLQSAAPVNGILAGETTYRATRAAIEYRDAAPVAAKGKAEPVPVWEAVSVRARFGVDLAGPSLAPLVGRRRELDLLSGALARARQERAVQLVTLVGVPGIGKSRLVAELFGVVEADPDLISWRQGRSLPYGEGVTFWAVSEMVKAQAGILEGDAADEAAAKLHAAVAAAVTEDADAEWVEDHLRPLVGLAATVGRDSGDEAFGAWRRFFEALAESRPLVLVFEDLHWADDRLLDFVDHLVDWTAPVPLLVVCTARPELLDRRPGWGGGKLNALTVALSPLPDDDTARLIAALLDQAVLPADTQSALLERAGGNPLYAEQYVRMFQERGSAADLPLPENVQGIIAARLDGLPAGEKSLLQDAAVIGKVFWTGVLDALGTGDDVAGRLHALERKDFVRRGRRSSVAGESEYAFRHFLARDVAYAQIPRPLRAEKHRRVAEWIAALAADRAEDKVEMLAHHYVSALEYATAAGQATDDLERRARSALREAGDRALALDSYDPARRFLRTALDLWPTDDPDRPMVLLSYGRSILWATEEDVAPLVEARDAFIARGDEELAAGAEALLGEAYWYRARGEEAREHFERAVELAEGKPASPSIALVLEHVGRFRLLAGDHAEGIRISREALAMTEELGLGVLGAHTRVTIATGRAMLGDRGGLAEMVEAAEYAEAVGRSPNAAARAHNNLASLHSEFGDARAARDQRARAIEFTLRAGQVANRRWVESEYTLDLFFTGEWSGALEISDRILALADAGSAHYTDGICRGVRSLIGVARGDVERALDESDRMLAGAREIRDPQVLWPSLGWRALVLADAGRDVEAGAVAGELLGLAPSGELQAHHWFLDLAYVLRTLGRGSEIVPLAERLPLPTRWVEAAAALGRNELEQAAGILDQMGVLPHAALVRLLAAEALVEEGRRAEADVELNRALAFFRTVDATRYVRRGEALLAAAG